MNRIIIAACAAGVFACETQPETKSADNGERIGALEARVNQLEKRPAAPAARPQPKRPDPAQVYFLPVDDKDAYRGATEAKVTLVEAYEYACPYCAIIEPVLAEVIEKYRGTDTLKVVSKQYVVHPNLATAAALATCAAARQDRFEPFGAALWDRSWKTEGGRPRMQADGLTREAIVDVATKTGLDRSRFEADLDGPECKARLEADRLALSRIGVRGTPSLYLNGRPYVGPRTADGLSKAIDAEVASFEAKRGSGGSVSGWYAFLMKDARRQL